MARRSPCQRAHRRRSRFRHPLPRRALTSRGGFVAKDNSFDIVSEVDLQEVDNAYQQATKELVQRYDLKDSGSSIELDKHAAKITLKAPSDFVARQVVDVLGSKLVKRSIDLKALSWGQVETATSGYIRQTASIVNGI